MRFTIALESEAPTAANDPRAVVQFAVRRALWALTAGELAGRLLDQDGNTIGHWSLELAPYSEPA